MFQNKNWFFLLLCGLTLWVAACAKNQPTTLTPVSAESTPLTEVTPTQQIAPTVIVTPTVQPTATPTTVPIRPSAGESILPAAIYFIDSYTNQLMRLERDGFTINQITNEAEPISDYDISADGTLLAYIADQSLTQQNLLTGEKSVRVAHPNDVATSNDKQHNSLRAPQIADDGISILYAQNGLRTVPTSGDAIVNILIPDSEMPTENAQATEAPPPLRFFNWGSWSPDFQHIIAEFSYYPEGGNLGIHSFTDGSFKELTGEISCCELTWSADGKSGYVTSNIDVYGNPGLAQVDLETGETTTLVGSEGINDDGNISYFRSGHVRDNGKFLTFVASVVDPSYYPLYQMYEISAEPFETTQLRQDSYFLGSDILWAEDGTGAIITEGSYDRTENNGTTYWLKSAEAPAIALPINGSNLQWGGRPQPVATLPDAAIAELKEIARQQFGVTLPNELGDIAVRPLLGKDSLWLAYTTGSRTLNPNFNHQLAIYRRVNDSWQLVSPYQFLTGAGSDLGGPDYLGEGGIKQVFIDSQSTWLFLEGGIGAHGGLLYLLRFDGSTLTAIVSNGNGTPGAGRIEDITEDGQPEILLDTSDAYVFAYAAGVRYVDYEVLRWNGTAVETMTLQTINDPTISSSIQESNNQAINYAKVDLWQDAQESMAAIIDDPALPTAIKENKQLINFLVKEREDETLAYNPYPLLGKFFAGDYIGTVEMMRAYTPQEVFNTPSVLVAGTVAEGSEQSMGERLVNMTTAALSVKPNSAEAYYLRAWGKFLIDSADPTIVEDLKVAAEQAPNDTFYQNTLASWQ